MVLLDEHGRELITSRPSRPADIGLQRWKRQYLRNINAKYDSAGTTAEMEKYWSETDYRSPRATNSPAIRQQIRSRARYECESNSYARGMVTAKTYDVIGTGPQLQLLTENRELNSRIEQEWGEWSRAVQLPRKLRTMYEAKMVDGETFAERIVNRRLMTPVQVDFVATESEMWTDLSWQEANPNEDDGILHDASRNPVRYRRLKQHPGDNDLLGLGTESVDVQAENVVHWFRCFRPGQMRGVSELTPSLSAFAEHRRMTFAVLSASELAASFAGVMYSDAQAFSDSPDEPEDAFDIVDIERRALLTLPAGWKMSQLKAEQPTTQFGDFSDQILKQIGRTLQMPLNIVSGSSRDYNFASGRLDYLLYWNNCDVEQHECSSVVMDRLFGWWLDEALLIPGYLPSTAGVRLSRRWVFPPRRPIDEVASAKADEIRFHLGHLTDDEYAQRQRIDPDEYYQQLSRMYQRRDEIGAPLPGMRNVQVDEAGESPQATPPLPSN